MLSHNILAYGTAYLIGCLASTVSAQAPSAANVAAVLGNPSQLAGTSVSLRPFSLQVLSNTTHAVISFTISKSLDSIGWMAIGTGSQMEGSDMTVVWPNAGSVIVSHRSVNVGHNPPLPASTPSASDLAYVAALSSNSSSSTTISVIRALKPSYSSSSASGDVFTLTNNNPFIFAYCSTNPGSSASAAMMQHDAGMYGSGNLDLSQNIAITAATSTSGSSGTATSSASAGGATQTSSSGVPVQGGGSIVDAGSASYINLLVAHGAIGAATWAVISPGMVLLATYGRKWKHWVQLHRWVQVIGTVILSVVTVALASVSINNVNGIHLNGAHQIVGIVILVLVVIQAVGGAVIHHLYNADRKRKPLRNIGHIILGIIITLLGFSQIASGLQKYTQKTGYSIHPAIWAIYGLLFGAFVGAWLLSAARSLYMRVSQGAPLRREKRLLQSLDNSEPGSPRKEERTALTAAGKQA